jgi:hypothetical protein
VGSTIVRNTLLWKPLSVEHPGAVVRLFSKGPTQSRPYGGFSFPEYADYLEQNDVLSGLVATRGVQVAFRAGPGDAVRAFGEVPAGAPRQPRGPAGGTATGVIHDPLTGSEAREPCGPPSGSI